ncbi:hypothetical protein M885DRAFT_206732 [Pelagophyceae sp. CCMP2097]|nr:hypothetical protein M885DRAFT_206732 [Pelagophyceae sp. CCMP2097]
MHTFRLRAALARRQPLRRFAARGPAALVVRNLPRDATPDDVRRAFEPFCDVTSVKIDRGVATVTTESAETEVVRDDMDGATVRGRPIAVELASDTTPARKPPTTQPRSNGKGAAIALNKRLVSSEAAGDVLSLFEAKGGDFNYVNFATSLHRLGILRRSLKKSSRPLLQKLVDRATSSTINESNEWESRHLANACWGIAKIGNVEAPALFKAIAAEAPKKIATFNSQNLANTVWAYATAGVEAPALCSS